MGSPRFAATQASQIGPHNASLPPRPLHLALWWQGLQGGKPAWLQGGEACLRSWRLADPARATSRRIHELWLASAPFALRAGGVGCDPRDHPPIAPGIWPSVLDK